MDSERKYINQLVPGMTLDQVFLVRDKDLRTTKSGDLYITCTLCDKTGTLSARLWQASENIFNSIPTDDFLHVRGRTEDYRGNLQFVILSCRPYPRDKVDLADFMATTQQDIEQMWAELLEILREIKNPSLRHLVKEFIEEQDFVAGFKQSPAAIQMHHPFVGGLLEHTLNVARAAKALLPLYPKINADLVLAGLLMHDMGKVSELTADTSLKYTQRGQLVGHITIAAIWVGEKAAAVAEKTGKPFPQKTLDLLQHIILSHHGDHEFGSPKLPAIPEAFFIHYLDNLDAKMFMTTNAVENDPDGEASFTPYLKQLETRIYKDSRELE